MAGITTDDGLNWIRDRIADEVSDNIVAIAVGTGTTEPAANDSSMENEVHRASVSTSTTDETGEREYSITLTGGTEVTAGTELTEFGLLTDTTQGQGTLVYREVRDSIEVKDGVQIEIIIPYDMDR